MNYAKLFIFGLIVVVIAAMCCGQMETAESSSPQLAVARAMMELK